ncbi:M1 family metallopeptidase [bacterium]|nr:M1 family metallopeptidase [bacterium]
MRTRHLFPVILVLLAMAIGATAQQKENQFRQIDNLLPTPNQYRTGSGRPGPAYWQQRADYDIAVALDAEHVRVSGDETITYHNNAPEPLDYLWIQLDQNIRAKNSLAAESRSTTLSENMRPDQLSRLQQDFDGGFEIAYVKDGAGNDLPHTVVNTMMRVDLPEPLKSGRTCTLRVKWQYLLNDRESIGGRSGYHYSERDSSYIFAIAQFFPRMAVYDDVRGWLHKQFLGSGEFALPFGDYRVRITVPADHIVGATGTLQNPREVLTAEQRKRLAEAAKSYDQTVLIVTGEEAEANRAAGTPGTKTWVFKAENVRDFAFASSDNFIWDAMAVDLPTHDPLAMSFYTAEGNPLWEKFSTKALAHGIRVFSKYTMEYPYPKAVSVMTGRGGGMEYPMLAFNGGKPNPDGTYSKWQKEGLVGVIIHEFGHNIFPMIVNSDERQWGWMDEGMNTFVEYLAEEEWSRNFNSSNGHAWGAVRDPRYNQFITGERGPIMTASDIDVDYGFNAYTKASAGLSILRETILGRELFDYAFREYVDRWKYKHPTPADFFRTMEDASGTDLDWFWHGWFFTTDKVDLGIDNVSWYRVRLPGDEPVPGKADGYITRIRNRTDIPETAVERDASLLDTYDSTAYDIRDEDQYAKTIDGLSDEQKGLVEAGYNFYQIDISSNGGLVMPIILKLDFADGTEEVIRIPVEIWRLDNEKVSKVIVTEKQIVKVTLDPYYETADVNEGNNTHGVGDAPKLISLSRYGQYRGMF